MYSQNGEDEKIVDYFGSFVGKFLDIGAYDGIRLSNTRQLVELGWSGVCIEPSPFAFPSLFRLYADDSKITVVNCAVDVESKLKVFYDSFGDAISSLSTKHKMYWERGSGTKFQEVYIKTVTLEEIFGTFGYDFNFINLDVEGINFEIFSHIPFERLINLKVICVEHDGGPQKMGSLIQKFGFKSIFQGSENLIMVR